MQHARRVRSLLGGIVVSGGSRRSAGRAFLIGGLLELARLDPGVIGASALRDIGEEAFKAPALDGHSTRIPEATE
ncbi:conjugal transfer protein TraD (plasmid) [Sinorhizobium meliloti]|nr:conjugal transfer protein TraD [Sinorhizobium meliloti]